MRSFEREPDFGDLDDPRQPPVEWEYVRTRRRPGAPDGSLPVRVLMIDEGVRVVDSRGPAAISIAACARSIGVSQGAPYTWFADAEDFRMAVAASLLSDLVAELALRASPTDGELKAGPASMLAADVALIVRSWAANGMGVGHVFGEGGPASQVELRWAAERFWRHVSWRVHEAAACACAASSFFGACHAMPASVEDILALCHGYAALARDADIERDTDALARAAGHAAVSVVGGAAAGAHTAGEPH